MKFTEVEALYAFNAIETHQVGVQNALTKVKQEIREDPSVFLDKIGRISMILNDLTSATNIQLKVLPVIDLGDKQQAIEQGLEERKEWIQDNKKSFKKTLEKMAQEIDG